MIPLAIEKSETPAVAVIRGGDFSKAAIFLGFSRGIFLDEHHLILEKKDALVFVSDDGKLGPTFEATWPPYLQEGGERVALRGAKELLVTDHQGKQLARVEVPQGGSPPTIRFVQGGGLLVALADGEVGQARILAPDGHELRALSSAHHWVLSENGQVFAVTAVGEKEHTITAYATASGDALGSVRVPSSMTEPPLLALAPQGDWLVVGYASQLQVLEIAKKKSRRVPGFPVTKERTLGEVRVTTDGEACLWSTDTTGRAGSCEAEHLVTLSSGARRALGDREACLARKEHAVKVKLPAPAPGRMRVQSHYFGPGGVCGLGLSRDLRTVARLEAAKGKTETDVKAVVYEIASGKRLAEAPLPAPEGWRPSAGLELNPDGSRLVAWVGPVVRLIDARTGKTLVDEKFQEPLYFPGNGVRVLGLFSGQTVFDGDGRPIKGWPSEGVFAPAR